MPTPEQVQQAQAYFSTLRSLRTAFQSPQEYHQFVRAQRLTNEHQSNLSIMNSFRRGRFVPSEPAQQSVTFPPDQAVKKSEVSLATLHEQINREKMQQAQPGEFTWSMMEWESYQTAMQETNVHKREKAVKKTAKIAADNLFDHVDRIDFAVSLWRSFELEQADTQGTQSFTQRVTRELAIKAKERWRNLTHEQIAELIKIYTYSPLAHKTAQTVLASYFLGPENEVEKQKHVTQDWERSLRVWQNTADILYTLAHTALDLVDDMPALRKVLRMQEFLDNDVIPMGSRFMVHSTMGLNFCTEGTPVQNKILKTRHIAERVFSDLETIAGISTNEYIPQAMKVLSSSEYHTRQAGMIINHVEKRIGYDERIKRREMITALSADTVHETGQSKNWLEQLIHDPTDPLERRYKREIGQQVVATSLGRKLVRENYAANSRSHLAWYTLPIENGSTMVSLIIPRSLLSQLKEVTKQAVAIYMETEQAQQFVHEENDIAPYQIFTQTFQIQNEKVTVLVRKLTEREKRQHELMQLQEIAFPLIETVDGKPVAEANQALAREIYGTRHIFPNARGYRVNFMQDTPLGKMGIENIDFIDDPEGTGEIVAIFPVGSVPLRIKIAKNFTLDLQGKTFPNQMLKESVHFLLLKLLQPIICSDPEIGEIPEQTEVTRVITDRVGYLRYLPPTWSYSAQAVSNYRRERHDDLEVMSAVRQETAREKANQYLQVTEQIIEQPNPQAKAAVFERAWMNHVKWERRSRGQSTYVKEITSGEILPPLDVTNIVSQEILYLQFV